jgi:hypothetical protein
MVRIDEAQVSEILSWFPRVFASCKARPSDEISWNAILYDAVDDAFNFECRVFHDGSLKTGSRS